MIVAWLDTAALLGFAAAFLLTGMVRGRLLDRQAKLFLRLGLFVYVFVSFSNILQHGGITDALDSFEDYTEVLFIPTFLIFVLTMQSRLELLSREKAEQALRESERSFREMAEMLPEIIFEVDLSGRITYANERAFTNTGYTRQDFAEGVSAMNLLVEEDRERGWKTMEQILKGQPTKGNEYTAQKKDGTTFPVLVFSAPILRDGQPTGLRGIIADMSHAKDLEAQLVQAQKMEAVGTLAGGVAHDFNNILQAITGYVELVLGGDRLHETDRRRLDDAANACARASELVRGLLTFSRKSEPSLQSMDLNREILNATSLLQRTLPKTVRIQTDLSPDVVPIWGDALQVEHILINLASNANDAMHEDGSITIRTENQRLSPNEAHARPGLTPGPYVLLTFTDDGTGMNPATAEQIFDPFFTTKEVGQGTGLGLSMVYGLVKGHNGHVSCHNISEKGTTFEIYFPVAPEAAS